MRNENMRKILSLTENSEIRMKVHGETHTYRFSEHPEKDNFELYVVENNKLQKDRVYGLSCMDMDDVVLTLMQDCRDGIIEEVCYVKAFEQEKDEFHQVYTKLTSMIPAYVSGNAEFEIYNLLDTLENLYNEQKHSNPSIQKENEVYYVHTCEENDGYNAKHEYKFSNKEEFLKFVRGEMAIDEWGDNCKRSYYEHIEEAYTKVDIDMTTLYQIAVTDSYDIDYEK